MERRDVLKAGLAAGVSGVLATDALANDIVDRIQKKQQQELLRDLCPPDGFPDQLAYEPSPFAKKFKAELFVMPLKKPVSELDPPPDPSAHQRYAEFKPEKLYEIRQTEFQWGYHPDWPYSSKTETEIRPDGKEVPKGLTWGWGFDDMVPGPTYHAKYDEPVLVRMINDLPPVGVTKAKFALPSTSIHLHNGHTASESDGNPVDWIDPGEFWDHHYANYPSGGDPREKLTTLWYHDHRLDFTAANVYAGLSGFYLLFDDQDTGDEKTGRKLPSCKYDVPIMLHDVKFALVPTDREIDSTDGEKDSADVDQHEDTAQVVFNGFETDGWLGDMITANRMIFPRFEVERRKYRFRIINGGPSRFYQLYLSDACELTKVGDKKDEYVIRKKRKKHMTVITGDGNFLPEPIDTESIYLSTAQRVDVIIDFSEFEDGDYLFLENRLVQTNGKGPSGDRQLSGDEPWETGIIRFDVKGPKCDDPSEVPDYFRSLPRVDLSEVKFRRLWDFDYDGGLWTINGRVMDNNRVDAGIEHGTAEIWTLRNTGNDWAHPVHSHFTEFILMNVDGHPVHEDLIQYGPTREEVVEAKPRGERTFVQRFMGGARRDVATINANNELEVYMRFQDFYGKYVMHCHNVVHEDHAMMIRWDIVEPGKGFSGPRPASEVESETHVELHPGQSVIAE